MRRPTTTEWLGATAVGLTGAVIGFEVWSVFKRRRRARDPVVVAIAGYRASPTRENATLNLLLSYAITAGIVRLSTHTIRTRGAFGPLRNRHVGGRHIHHYIPGIFLILLAGAASVISRNDDHDAWLAIPFGAGAALTLDEAALLVELEDVYWSEEGILSVQVTLAALALLGATALGIRALGRGEDEVLGAPLGGGDLPDLARAA